MLLIANASDLSIANEVTAPIDKTIWTIDSKESPREGTVTLTATDLFVGSRAPLDVVLAIDGSDSLGTPDKGGTDPWKRRVDASQQFVGNLDPTKDRVGVVHWNGSIVGTPLALTSNFTLAKEYLNLSDARGNTSIWIALNASASLMNSARPNAIKVIVLFSDGEDTYVPKLDFKGLAGRIKQSGIQIYTIGLGESNIADLQAIGKYSHVNDANAIPAVFEDVAADIMGSLSNVQIKYMVPDEIEILNPSETVNVGQFNGGRMLIWDIGSMMPNRSKILTFEVRSQDIGVYSLGMASNSVATYSRTNGTSGIQAVPSTKINVKSDGRFFYKGDGKGGSADGPLADPPLDKKYRLSIDKYIEPPSDKGCQDVVIDVTTPPVQGNSVVVFALDSSGSTGHNDLSQRIVDEVGAALKNRQNVEYARVDWDGDATAPISIRTMNRLAPPVDPPQRPFRPARDWARYDSDPLECEDFESTIYAEGLINATNRLNARRIQVQSCFTEQINEWIVIFITGKSEFSTRDLYTKAIPFATQSNVKVYSIGIDISDAVSSDTREEALALKDISARTGGRAVFVNNPDDISKVIEQILAESSEIIATKSVVKNVVVSESIYPYLSVLGTNIPPTSENVNSDGTTTLVWMLGNMLQDKTERIVISTALNLSKLPLDVTDKRTSVSYTPAVTTPTSEVGYMPICGETKQPIPLPEGELSIFCGEPCSIPKVSQAAAPQERPAPASETTLPQKTQPGFEMLAAILGLIAIACIARRI